MILIIIPAADRSARTFYFFALTCLQVCYQRSFQPISGTYIGLRSSVFGLRSSVFGLLHCQVFFLFSLLFSLYISLIPFPKTNYLLLFPWHHRISHRNLIYQRGNHRSIDHHISFRNIFQIIQIRSAEKVPGAIYTN